MPPENLAKYSALHAAVWPAVLAKITECGIRNYSIYHRGGWLFSYFEYVGDDYEADMARMADDRTTQDWWAINKPLQEPLEDRAEGEWWAALDELFHAD
jgi:L-rhamnose mutarotase